MIAKKTYQNVKKIKESKEDDKKYYPKPGEEHKNQPNYSPDPDKEKGKQDYRKFRKEDQKRNINKKSLVDLYNKALSTLPQDPRIILTHEPGKLEITLDKMQGLNGYEDLSINEYTNLFDIKYRGLAENALRTFSQDTDYFNLITNSNVLSYFLNELKDVKSKYPDYARLLILRKEGDVNEAKSVIDFFSEAFKEKLFH